MRRLILAHGEREYLRFIVSGGLNTGINLALYAGGILIGLSYVTANCIAWITGVVIAFWLQSRFVFRKTGDVRRRLPKFVLANLASLFISTALLTLLIKVFGVNAILASIIAMPVVVAVNFLAAKFLIFK